MADLQVRPSGISQDAPYLPKHRFRSRQMFKQIKRGDQIAGHGLQRKARLNVRYHQSTSSTAIVIRNRIQADIHAPYRTDALRLKRLHQVSFRAPDVQNSQWLVTAVKEICSPFSKRIDQSSRMGRTLPRLALEIIPIIKTFSFHIRHW